MRNKLFCSALILFFSVHLGYAQIIGQVPARPELPAMDGKETLEWVVERTQRIEKILNGAILTHDQINLMMRLLDVHVEFDAISLVGLYCKDAQVAAERGRESSDLLSFRDDMDMNSMMLRAMEAKEHAVKARQAASKCLEFYKDDMRLDTSGFAPNRVLVEEAGWAMLDLEDGLASRDFHIFSQKTEHAIRLIEEIEHIATTLSNCSNVENYASKAQKACLQALAAPNWLSITKSVKLAKQNLKRIQEAHCTYNKAE